MDSEGHDQAGLGLCCPDMPEDTFYPGAARKYMMNCYTRPHFGSYHANLD